MPLAKNAHPRPSCSRWKQDFQFPIGGGEKKRILVLLLLDDINKGACDMRRERVGEGKYVQYESCKYHARMQASLLSDNSNNPLLCCQKASFRPSVAGGKTLDS